VQGAALRAVSEFVNTKEKDLGKFVIMKKHFLASLKEIIG